MNANAVPNTTDAPYCLLRLGTYLEQQMGFNLRTIDLEVLTQQLEYSEQEFSSFENYAIAMASLIAVHETYFLRHTDQFDWLCHVWLPQWLQQHPEPQRTLRILSAGCATGEEAYSLAARLQPIMAAAGHRHLSIKGIDINEKAINKAHLGRYGLWSLRGIDVRQEQHWLDIGLRTVSVKDWVRQCVTFSCHNLNEKLHDHTTYDLILCRNVLIYMHETAIDNILNNLKLSLAQDGILLLGPCDPNPSKQCTLVPVWQDGIRCLITQEHHFENHDHTKQHTHPKENKKHTHAHKEHTEIKHDIPLSNPALKPYAAIEVLIKTGYYMEARDLLEKRIQHDAQDTRSYVMLCMLFMDLDEVSTALEMARMASYLAPNEPFPNYLLAVIRQRYGDLAEARSASHWVYEQLSTLHEDLPIPLCEEITVKQLKEVVRAGF